MDLNVASTNRKRTPPEPPVEALEITQVMHALGDPMRLAIVRAIAQFEAGRACNQCACSSVPKSTLAHHFKVLRKAGLIRSLEAGTTLKNTLRSEELEMRFPGLLAVILRM